MTVKKKQFEPFSIFCEKLDAQSYMSMSHNFHEFIFVSSGRGIHFNQQFSTQFGKGDLFLVKPNEEHAYIIEEATEIYIVRFTRRPAYS